METDDLIDLIQRHSGLIHRVAYLYCRNETDREDIVQEVAVQLWRSRDRYDATYKETTWVYRIALNVAISFYRRERRHLEGRKAHSVMLERSLAIDERLLREMLLGKVRGNLMPYILRRAAEVALGLVAMFVIMPVLASHWSEPRYVIAGGALAGFTIVMTALSVYLTVNSLQLDYGRPVAAIQRDVECLKMVEYRALKWPYSGVWLFGYPLF